MRFRLLTLGDFFFLDELFLSGYAASTSVQGVTSLFLDFFYLLGEGMSAIFTIPFLEVVSSLIL